MRKATDTQLTTAYAKTASVWRVAEQFGMCGQSVHERLVKLNAINRMNVLTDDERRRMDNEYCEAVSRGKLQEFADSLGRSKHYICMHAGRMGLTKKRSHEWMRDPSHRAACGQRARDHIKNNGHPRGMAGKKHTLETRMHLAKTSKKTWDNMNAPQQRAMVVKQLKAKLQKRGTLAGPRIGTTWKASWRVVGGKRVYFRSRWEANYARYLQWLVEQRQITGWEHEPETFWFDAVKRGCVSYLPDFRVTNPDGSIEYHEVKGWMDARSKTKIKRMKKYHPKVKLVVIDGPVYKKLHAAVRSIIGGWEQ
jgi:hypothetical protein